MTVSENGTERNGNDIACHSDVVPRHGRGLALYRARKTGAGYLYLKLRWPIAR
ncbi:hypothetical protein RLO149_c036580 [Roseobacter litoralis Och 149]|uniref:Uncharacterized protein n=1 Tax=Roseobacter litoralis (strain ATCC 49566 / DSM 6996 / JCM 21268 / NBRC 15278 / OCh 149) TaxID=391595 RepID=F7ZBK0_ROSLO|nr:hypothetical protein RLO149_c036580 [Roseobacter litoralis Och 149]